MANRLIKKIEFKGKIVLATGLHIGGTNSSLQIGGIDKGVIRNPLNNQPFIPGSSIKGKLRSLLEISIGIIKEKDNFNGPADTGISADLFGNASGKEKQKASRLIVRDCELLDAEGLLEKTEIPYTEGKTEVVIDRITSAANPRQIERVPAGARFNLNMVLNVFEQDGNEQELLEALFKSLELLKDDYLGGNGSRGYGQVRIHLDRISEKSTDGYYGSQDASPVDITGNYRER
ncbi:MAG: type III-A CRISPR-associated RAMP protein Csm3, partial [Bacteroidales bacterium]|nr:type III-A CRISPR-associated RAMP protein Csm3 [Bacteroidales bacterium]